MKTARKHSRICSKNHMPKLLLKFEAAVIKEITLDKPVFTVGRKPDNDIVLDHPTVSGHHCKIYSAGGSSTAAESFAPTSISSSASFC